MMEPRKMWKETILECVWWSWRKTVENLEVISARTPSAYKFEALLLESALTVMWHNVLAIPVPFWCSKLATGLSLMFIGPCVIVIVEEWKTNLMSLAILFHFLCGQHVSDINISIIKSLRLCCWITTSVVSFSVRCVLEMWCGWFWVVLVLHVQNMVST